MPFRVNAIPAVMVAVFLCSSADSGPAPATASPPAPAAHAPGPTLATEDTLHMDLPEVLVRAPRVTLAEILQRVARGEARRESLMLDQTLVATTRIVRNPAGARDTAELVRETVVRIYRKKPGKLRTEQLRDYVAHPERNRRFKTRIEFRSGMGERIVNYAFRPEAWRDYRYTIAGRDVVGDHVVYRIAFEPRSLLSSDPAGLVWVDTNDFVILRQEARFPRSPMPLLLKRIERLVVERRRVGDFWVLHRALFRMETTVPLPSFGRSFDLSLSFDQYVINRGLDDRLFAGSPKRGKEDDE